MKLLYCQQCGDIIAPHPTPRQPRWCRCKRHAVWWEDPRAGTLRLHDAVGSFVIPVRPRAYVIGLTNMLLGYDDEAHGHITADVVNEMIDAHEDSYIFKRWRSLVIRIRPGESGDTRWAALPEGTKPEDGWRDLARLIDRAQELLKHEPNTTEWNNVLGELEEVVKALNENLPQHMTDMKAPIV